jgi:hypothetical protein
MNKKGLPVWKWAYSFSVYIILPVNRLKIAKREWKMFNGELSAAVNKY